MAYLYRHIRLDKNEPFYIGIGSNPNYRRAYTKNKRNKYWHNIVSTTDYRVEIMLDDISWEEACEKEMEFISMYGRKDNKSGILCNMTNGGDGTFGRSLSKETKDLISKARIGSKHSEETKLKMSIDRKGRTLSEEARLKVSKATKGKKKTQEQYEKMINIFGVAVVNKKTGEGYRTIKEAAIKNNIKYSTLKAMLSGKLENKTDIIHA
jgi:hypothetical protein